VCVSTNIVFGRESEKKRFPNEDTRRSLASEEVLSLGH
jgi:hypothetical protein